MSVGLLIITHNTIGSALLETATKMLGACPLRAETIEITEDMERDLLLGQAQAMAAELDSGDGVLVLTDLYGSTPANIASALGGEHVRVLAGVNLPMLVRLLNYPALPLPDLADKALSGGRDGVLSAPSAGGGR